jgi:hypothetical protein
MSAIARDGFDFPRWMQELDKESRVRLDRFLDLAAQAMPNAKGVGWNPGVEASRYKHTNTAL